MGKGSVLISVIMSTFREPADYLRLAIESVLNQTFSNFEFLIAIDDPDNCEHVRIMQEYVKKDPRIIWYVNKENLGLLPDSDIVTL